MTDRRCMQFVASRQDQNQALSQHQTHKWDASPTLFISGMICRLVFTMGVPLLPIPKLPRHRLQQSLADTSTLFGDCYWFQIKPI